MDYYFSVFIYCVRNNQSRKKVISMKYKWLQLAHLVVNILLIVFLLFAIKEIKSLNIKLDYIQRPIQIFDCEYKYSGALS